MATTTPKDAKKALRRDMKSKLATLTEQNISKQSSAAQTTILNYPPYQEAKRLSIYLSMPKAEAQTILLVKDALAAGKKVFVPYIHRPRSSAGEVKKRSVIEMLHLRSAEEYDGLERDGWGIPSLSAEGFEGRENATGGMGMGGDDGDGEGGLDLVVVPGVAFDHGRNRLGHGAGFYDEFLTRFGKDGRRKRPALGRAFLRTCFVHCLHADSIFGSWTLSCGAASARSS